MRRSVNFVFFGDRGRGRSAATRDGARWHCIASGSAITAALRSFTSTCEYNFAVSSDPRAPRASGSRAIEDAVQGWGSLILLRLDPRLPPLASLGAWTFPHSGSFFENGSGLEMDGSRPTMGAATRIQPP